MPDHNGMLWITSFNGLMSYDAERFKIYDKNNTPVLETDGFLSLTESPDSTLYFGTQGSGLIRYKNGSFESVTSDKIHIPKSIRSIMIDNSGTLYFSGQNAGLYVMNNDTAYRYPGKEIESVSSIKIVKTASGTIWIGTEGRGIFKLDGTNITQYDLDDGLMSNYVSDIHINEEGTVYFATPEGMHQISPEGKISVIEALRGIYINVFLVDQWNTYWLGGEAGLFRYDPKNEKLERITNYRSIDFVRISSIIKDRQGSIWLTSSRSGLIQIKESLVSNISEPALKSNRVNIIHETINGRILIGTDLNQLDIWENNQVTTFPIQTNLKGNGIRAIIDEPDGTLWLATYAGMLKISNGIETLYNTNTGMPANTFRVAIKDQFGNFWFGTRSGGLVKFKDNKIQATYNLQNGLSSNFILALTEDINGSIYVGTNAGGMSIISPTGDIQTFHVKDDDSGILIFNIDLLEEGGAILTTNLGPAYFDGSSIRIVPLQTNGRSSTYFDIIWDQADHIWLTTNIGILKIQKKDWRDYLNGLIEEVPFVVINEMSGMNNRECTGATKATMVKDGQMYFPTLGGVCIIDPEKQLKSDYQPQMIISHTLIDNQINVVSNQNLVLPPDANRVVFYFSLLNYQTIGQNRYSYKLNGFDDQPSLPSNAANVAYTNLPPGKYDFTVSGSSDGKIWSTNNAAIRVIVKPYFYETIWFYILIFITIASIIYGVFRWRVSFINRQNSKLKKVNSELDRFVYSASHELRSPLTSIMGIVDLAKTETGDLTEYLNHIQSSVKRLDEFIKDIIDYSRNTRLEITYEEVDFDSIVNNILIDISYTPNYPKITCRYNNALTEPYFSDVKRLKVALTNLITNAIKHHAPEETHDAFVHVDISRNKNHIIINIEDNGPGIPHEHQKAVFKMFYRATVRTEGSGIGLYIVKEIVEKLHGSITLQSQPGRGSKFQLKLPITKKL